jgi:hypothetical protein
MEVNKMDVVIDFMLEFGERIPALVAQLKDQVETTLVPALAGCSENRRLFDWSTDPSPKRATRTNREESTIELDGWRN